MVRLPNCTTPRLENIAVIGPSASNGDLSEILRAMVPAAQIRRWDDCLSAIVDLASNPATTVLAVMDPANHRFPQMLAGVREAVGTDAKIIVACSAENEPFARRFVGPSVDDYVLLPLDPFEMQQLLGCPANGLQELPLPHAHASEAADQTRFDWTNVIRSASDGIPQLVRAMANFLRGAFRANAATASIGGISHTDGDPVRSGVLISASGDAAFETAQCVLADRDAQPYTTTNALDLETATKHFAELARVAEQMESWRNMALTDACTGLPNRRFLLDHLNALLVEAAQRRLPITVVLVDVDDFKTYNDGFGHDAGDDILRRIARLFREHCRDQDVVARYGGDEFALVFWDACGPRVEGSAHPQCALDVLDRFSAALRNEKPPWSPQPSDAAISVSAGLATFPWNGSNSESLLHFADEALLAAKRAGKNRVFVFADGNPHSEPSPDAL